MTTDGGGLPVMAHVALGLLRRLGWRLRDRMAGPPAPSALAEAAVQRARAAVAAGRPLRVGFVVASGAKWSNDPLFRALMADPAFQPGFFPALSDTALRLSRAARRDEYGRERAFFAARGPILGELYDSARDRVAPLSALACDLAILQQPWGMQDLPRRLAGRIPALYVHYGFPVILNDRMQFGLPDFHPFLWRHVVASEGHKRAMLAAAPGTDPARLLVAGYPKLDVYRQPAPARDRVTVWPRAADTARRRVIFAPHHAFGAGTLGMATFEWSGPAMLALARAHPEVDFVLKPHPNLEHGLERSGAMTPDQRRAFFADWRAGANTAIVEGGQYFDLFRTSDAMITDSGSFLAEYLPTGRPILRLQARPPAALNPVGQALADGFYTADTPEGLRDLFGSVILKGDDPLATVRQGALPLVMPFDRPASVIVHAHLRAAFGLDQPGQP